MRTISIDRFKVGQKVRVFVPCTGVDDDENEVTIPAGGIAQIVQIDHYDNHQGWAIHIGFPNGVINVFDEADNPLYPFEILDAPAVIEPEPREFRFNIRGMATAVLTVMAVDEQTAELLAERAVNQHTVAYTDLSIDNWEVEGLE